MSQRERIAMTEWRDAKIDLPPEFSPLPAGKRLTAAQKALIAMLAKIAVNQYLAREDGK